MHSSRCKPVELPPTARALTYSSSISSSSTKQNSRPAAAATAIYTERLVGVETVAETAIYTERLVGVETVAETVHCGVYCLANTPRVPESVSCMAAWRAFRAQVQCTSQGFSLVQGQIRSLYSKCKGRVGVNESTDRISLMCDLKSIWCAEIFVSFVLKASSSSCVRFSCASLVSTRPQNSRPS